jgi:elongation factor 1-gamma
LQASFYETFDAAGWSVFRGDYKYNEECKVLFMTSNLIAGFIQRTEEIRKWLFGTLTIRGGEGPRYFPSLHVIPAF